MISCRIVSRVNGYQFTNDSSFSTFFDKIHFFFRFFEKLLSCSKFMDLLEPVKLFKSGNRDILDSVF